MDVLVVDNFDSFTYMLVDYLRQAGAVCHVIRNNEPMNRLIDTRFDAVALSPGPGVPRQAGRLMAVIDYYHRRVPMLGVCLGHQALGEFFGAKLVPAIRPMHGKVSTVQLLTNDVLTQGLPARFSVTRYHSLLLTDLPPELVSLAVTSQGESTAPAGVLLQPGESTGPSLRLGESTGPSLRLGESTGPSLRLGELMAMRHRTLPLWGVQFHPEAALTENGLFLLKNWINFLLFTGMKNESTVSLTAGCA